MSGHTPGPWVSVAVPTNVPKMTQEQCDVVEVNASATDGLKYKVCTVYWDRDRRLIAAAPEMKQLLLDFCDSLRDNDCIPTYRQMLAKKASLALLEKVV